MRNTILLIIKYSCPNHLTLSTEPYPISSLKDSIPIQILFLCSHPILSHSLTIFLSPPHYL